MFYAMLKLQSLLIRFRLCYLLAIRAVLLFVQLNFLLLTICLFALNILHGLGYQTRFKFSHGPVVQNLLFLFILGFYWFVIHVIEVWNHSSLFSISESSCIFKLVSPNKNVFMPFFEVLFTEGQVLTDGSIFEKLIVLFLQKLEKLVILLTDLFLVIEVSIILNPKILVIALSDYLAFKINEP